MIIPERQTLTYDLHRAVEMLESHDGTSEEVIIIIRKICSRFSTEELMSRISRSALSIDIAELSQTCPEESASSSLSDIAIVVVNNDATPLTATVSPRRQLWQTRLHESVLQEWDCCFSFVSRKAALTCRTVITRPCSKFKF